MVHHFDESFFVFNADILCDFSLDDMLRYHRKQKADITIAATYVKDPTAYGVIEYDSKGYVTRFTEKPKPSQVRSHYINAGIYIFEPHVLDGIPDRKPLSVQVHPDDDYAWKNEKQNGKTEMWYIIDCNAVAFVYLGVNRELHKAEARQALENGRFLDLLEKVPVCPGESYLVEAGTVHAIGEGILLAEVQQSSNLTYRLYDFRRLGADGKPRELHIEKALDVMRLSPSRQALPQNEHLACCSHFVVNKLTIKGGMELRVTEDHFAALLVLEGNGVIASDLGNVPYAPYKTFFVPAGFDTYRIENDGVFLLVLPVFLRIRRQCRQLKISVRIP